MSGVIGQCLVGKEKGMAAELVVLSVQNLLIILIFLH